jgi:hypothetical protein
MSDKTLEFKICGHCGSTTYLEDYPVTGTTICAKCAHEIIKIPLRELPEEEIIQQPCPFCGKEGEEGDTVFDDDKIIVFKCKGCGKLDGYRIALEPTYASNEDLGDGDYNGKAVAIAKREGNSIYSASKAKELAKALKKKDRHPKEKCKKQLTALIYEKRQKMQQSGIEPEIISTAKWKLTCFIDAKGPFTKKQLQSQFSAAVSLAQDDLVRMGRFHGKKITERQMEHLFNVDRKTIRKWKRPLKEQLRITKLGISTRKQGNYRAFSAVEFPKEIKSITKLDKPYKDKCDFCEEPQLLEWRITFVNGSWSDLCKSSFERLKEQSLEYDWEIEKRIVSQ